MRNTKNLKVFVLNMMFVIEALLVIFMSAFSTLLSNAIDWMFDTWSNLSMDELVYQLNAPFDGTNSDMVFDFIERCAPPAILVLFLVLILLIAFWENKKVYHSLAGVFFVSFLLLAGIRVHMALKQLGAEEYSESQDAYAEYVNENYIDAGDVEIVFPEKKRNLIYIFLESMEITYADKANGGSFDQNCIQELTKLAQENEDFSGSEQALNGGYSMPSTTWTMGGMFAQTSGFPLSISQEDTEDMDGQESFMPDIVAIGDILKKEGYSQTLHIGSDAAFGGRKAYFTEHGGYAMKDYYYSREKGRFPEDYHVWWGYEDKRLFEYAKEEILQMAKQKEPFNFTMLTVDTHFEDGYVCEDCQNKYGDNQYANVMACSSKKVAEFVKWIQQQDFYENTSIVISGDHPTMDSDFCENIDAEYVRKVYTTYINSAAEPANPDIRRDYTTFDNFPTTLASLGVMIEGDRLGLGTNLFSGTPTLTEQYGRGALEGQLKDKLPQAEVKLEAYDEEQAYLLVSMSDFHNVRNGMTDVKLAVWTGEEQTDLQWIPAERKSDDRYEIRINLADYEYKTGKYTMHAYIWDHEGRPWMVGSIVQLIDHVIVPESASDAEDEGYTDYTDYTDYTYYTGGMEDGEGVTQPSDGETAVQPGDGETVIQPGGEAVTQPTEGGTVMQPEDGMENTGNMGNTGSTEGGDIAGTAGEIGQTGDAGYVEAGQ